MEASLKGAKGSRPCSRPYALSAERCSSMIWKMPTCAARHLLGPMLSVVIRVMLAVQRKSVMRAAHQHSGVGLVLFRGAAVVHQVPAPGLSLL